jgi:hypothetical protein
VGFLLVFLFAGNASATGEDPGFTSPVLERPLFLQTPHHLEHVSHNWQTAVVRLRIGPTGEVEDWIPIDLPHHGLITSLDRAFAGARFIPAMEEGEPVTVDVSATIPLFEIGSYGVFTETISEHIESRLAEIIPGRNRLVLSPPDELDEPLEIVSRGRVYQAVDESGNPVGGTVGVRFYIDPEGVPHLIRAEDETPPVLAQAAMDTVAGLRFSKPRRHHQPTVVRVRMPVILGPGQGD